MDFSDERLVMYCLDVFELLCVFWVLGWLVYELFVSWCECVLVADAGFEGLCDDAFCLVVIYGWCLTCLCICGIFMCIYFCCLFLCSLGLYLRGLGLLVLRCGFTHVGLFSGFLCLGDWHVGVVCEVDHLMVGAGSSGV